MTTNFYGRGARVGVFMDTGRFWRCRHGHAEGPCARCGVFHPVRWLRHVIGRLR